MDKSILPVDILEQVNKKERALDRIRGCMIGGAAGDALGYPVEFMTYDRILSAFGPDGIRAYQIDPESQLALISDDTQMSLYTANGILYGETRRALQGVAGKPRSYVYLAYLDWLETQRSSQHAQMKRCWLNNVKALWNNRSPGATCLDALASGEQGSTEHRINHSKGCGGVMRVSPVALVYYDQPDEEIDMEGAEVAALTHSHSLGFIPAAFLTHVLKHLVDPDNTMSLVEIIEDAKKVISGLFSERKHLGVFIDLINKSVELASNSEPDEENISYIGEGWCADETLGIALYCALRHQDDFSEAIIASVNHSGDSDSTGAITGNIMGALIGYEAIPQVWKEKLELADTILEMADDICFGCLMTKTGEYQDEEWVRKYVHAGDPS